ncbi:MAG: hypothetical protein ACFE68_10130 [Candidatus Hodarchaeota archaeon]
MKDFQHKLSKKLVENTRANTIIIGDLNVKNIANSNKKDKKRDKSLHRAVQNKGLAIPLRKISNLQSQTYR